MLLRQIQHFQAIVQEKSFTEAAARCYISQSGISQSIKALEKEIGAQLLIRKNRGFVLTEAGNHFYRKSLIITADLDQLVRETARIANKDVAKLSLGCLSAYGGKAWSNAIALFAEKYPTVALTVTSGNHEDLYEGLVNETLDLVLNDQRRAFSDMYENLVLQETICYVEMSTYNPLSKLDAIGVEELKNTPCILVASESQQEEERNFYRDIIGLNGEFLFAKTLQEAHVMVVANRGIMPVEGAEGDSWLDASMKRLPLMRNHTPVKRTYCAFWKKDHAGKYVETFAQLLKSML